MAPPLPARIGPVEFGELGRWVAVRCPKEYVPIVKRAEALWEPGSQRWLVERRRSASSVVFPLPRKPVSTEIGSGLGGRGGAGRCMIGSIPSYVRVIGNPGDGHSRTGGDP